MAIHRQLAMCRRVRMLRENEGWTQAQMAEKLRMSQAAYSRLESGSSEMSLYRVMQMSEVFKLPLTKLIEGL